MIRLRGRITLFLIVVLFVILFGMLGFIYIKTLEGNSPTFIDAFSWVIVTLSTLGSYTADTTLNSPIGKLFTSIIVVLGLSIFFVGTPLVIIPWIEQRIKTVVRPRPSPIQKKDHVIICGYSEIIDEVMDALQLHNVGYVIIEDNEKNIKRLENEHIHYVKGDPTSDDILKKANIHLALSLIAAKNDEKNAFICLSAKSLAKNLRVIAISEKTNSAKTLYAAGATTVINPRIFAGSILGKRACHDYTLEVSGKFASFGDLEIRQYAILSSSIINGLKIRRARIRSVTGAIIIGLWREGKLLINPSPDEQLLEGITILAMGTKKQLDSLSKLTGGEK
ncbi:MAG: NAD-binding protein [Candidatus Thermoplasmatota archaeon]|nr:NAD-binding protein [Candidatus Thermoplasmatota archaeon]